MSPRVKVCCISTEAEVRTAVDAGADLLGFVAPPLGGLGVIPIERIARLVRLVPPGVTSVLLTGLTEADAIIDQVAEVRPGALQLVRSTTAATRRVLRDHFPCLRLLPVVHVHGPESVAAAQAAAEVADGLVLDSAVLDGPTEQLGATGRTHDWSVSAAIVQAVDVPVFLAGGLSAANVAEARRTVSPHGLDLCSSVRTEDVLDPAKVRAFLAAAREVPA